MMNHQRITLKLLEASSQPRPLITSDVDKLAASIKEVGLIQPITVRPFVVMNGIAEQGFQIVAGHHRVAACRALGWTEIDAIVIESAGHLQAELVEIDENLCRSELSASQRSHYTKRRKQIWEALHPEPSPDYGQEKDDGVEQPRQIVAPVEKHGHAQTKGFAASTAEVTGENVRQIQRNVARAEAIGDDILKLSGTSLDKGVELDALARLPEPDRKELIERAQAGEKVTARPVAVAPAPAHTAPASALSLVPPADPTTIDTFTALMGRALSDMRKVMQCDSNKTAAQKLAAAVRQASPAQLIALDLVLTDLLELGSVGMDEVAA